MFPARFDYIAPTSIAEAVQALRSLGEDAKVLAGGQSLIPLMKLRLATPAYLVDIGRIEELAGIRADDDGWLLVGAMATERDLERSGLVRRGWPVVAEASATVADPLVRTRATLGGNLAHADPANDHPAVMLALGADVLVQGPDGQRAIPARELFTGMFETSLEPDELLTAIRIPPLPARAACVYVKKERQAGDFAIAGAAAWVRVEDGLIAEARVALTNVGPMPERARALEERLMGERADPGTAERIGATVAGDVEPSESLRGSADYRRQMVRVAVEDALAAAVAGAQARGRAS
jgi:carbon-monoxide dehydrogenase medium subunit